MEVLWNNCLEEIEKQVLPENFNTWFTPTYPCYKDDKALTIAVPNRFYEKCLTENYLELIQKALETVSDKKLEVRFRVNSDFKDKVAASADAQETPKVNDIPRPTPLFNNGFLNPKYHFENFVVGPNNQFAHAAGQAVAGNPAHNYNPLFLYGAVGLGKTHLLHAIGNAIVKGNPQTRVRYISAESFTVDLIESIKKDRMQGFRERYRPLDVLLVDDIQFIAGKERTQEEFFYTFNTLYEYHKQIVISSDRYPKDMQNIEERLRSRFESGLIADIMPPDLETKMAILYQKAEIHQKCLPQDVAMFLANNIKSNIRELEGLLLRVIAYGSFTRREINLELAQEVLKDFTIDKNRHFTIPNIQKTVAQFFQLKIADLKSKKRSRDISIPRQIAMYICREYTQASLPEIGRQFGGKDHTTVIFSYRKVSGMLNENKEMGKRVQEIIKLIENG
ncbi:MAG: chromosomal replication initiator protein DnaA [Nitrospinota bacterium]|nr:chromosomal replication initiator protein DnaA [Nitrospinota bacterium]